MKRARTRLGQLLGRALPSNAMCGRIALAVIALTAIFFAGMLGGWATSP